MVCLYLDMFMGGFRWGITLGSGEAMLMRGGACATELCLMVGCVCVCSVRGHNSSGVIPYCICDLQYCTIVFAPAAIAG